MDLTGGQDHPKPNAIRALLRITTPQMILNEELLDAAATGDVAAARAALDGGAELECKDEEEVRSA